MKQDISITNERIRILYKRALASIITPFITAGLMTYILREQIAVHILLIWLGSMVVATLIRYWLLIDYNKNNQKTTHHEKYEIRYAYAAFYAGLNWALIIAYTLYLPAVEYRTYGLLLFTAVISLAIPVFSSSLKTFYYFIAPSIIISVPALLFQGGDNTALGIAMILYSAVIVRAGKENYNTLYNALTLQHKKSGTEKRIQEIIDHVPASISVKDLEGRYTFLNMTVAKSHNVQPEKLLGKNMHEIFPKDVADELSKNDNDVINTKQTMEYVESMPWNGTLKHFMSIRFPLFDEEGNLYATGAISTDITKRFQAEQSLHISQQRLLLHREQSPVGIVEWNPGFEILYWNPAAEKIFGYTKDEVIGAHITERILPKSARPMVEKLWESLIENKGAIQSLNENITKNGRTILCEWHSTPLVDDSGNAIGVTSIVSDITDREKQEENERQMQKMDAIGQLTGGIAHDFNNMLGVILGFSGLLKKSLGEDNPKQLKYCDQILKAGERAKKLTSNLLEFSSTAPSSKETININELLSDMEHMLETTLTARIQIILGLEEGLWPICLDKAQLEDAILNMGINAMHAMPEGGKLTMNSSTKHLTKKQSGKLGLSEGDYVVLSIADTGCGMPSKVQKQIFDPFFTTKGTEGTGLGLSQVYGFVQQAGGMIDVFSKMGQGTRLTLYFPRCTENKVAEIEAEGADSVQEVSGNATILVVDDDAALLSLNENILTTAGYNVLLANGAAQALEILKDKSVNLMLSDVIMPEVNGYQLAAEVEKLYPDIKIQMITGYSEDHNKSVANNKLYQQRLNKPVAVDDLLRRVSEILGEAK